MRNSTYCVLAITFILIVGPEAELVDLSHTLDKNANNWPIKGFKQYNHTNLTVGKCRYIRHVTTRFLRKAGARLCPPPQGGRGRVVP